MMERAIMFLKKIGLIPPVTQADVDEAGDEDVKRLAIAAELARKVGVRTLELNHQANGALRDAAQRVRSSSAFAEFERSVRRDR